MLEGQTNKDFASIEREASHTYMTKDEAIKLIKDLEYVVYSMTLSMREIIAESQYDDMNEKMQELKNIDLQICNMQQMLNINYIIL